jgi:hypothetical protein
MTRLPPPPGGIRRGDACCRSQTRYFLSPFEMVTVTELLGAEAFPAAS